MKYDNYFYIPLLPTDTFEVVWPCLGVVFVIEETTARFEVEDVPGYGGGGGKFT